MFDRFLVFLLLRVSYKLTEESPELTFLTFFIELEFYLRIGWGSDSFIGCSLELFGITGSELLAIAGYDASKGGSDFSCNFTLSRSSGLGIFWESRFRCSGISRSSSISYLCSSTSDGFDICSISFLSYLIAGLSSVLFSLSFSSSVLFFVFGSSIYPFSEVT